MMIDISKLKSDLKRDEGIRLKPYVDSVGKSTIGCGRNLSDNGISMDEMNFMLNNDIEVVLRALDKAFPFWTCLSDARQRALANLTFNVGFSRLLSFRKMLDALKARDWQKAHDEALNSEWAEQTGSRAQRIALQFLNG